MNTQFICQRCRRLIVIDNSKPAEALGTAQREGRIISKPCRVIGRMAHYCSTTCAQSFNGMRRPA